MKKFVRFAKEVWGINGDEKTEEQTAEAGPAAMESWRKELGLDLPNTNKKQICLQICGIRGICRVLNVQ